MLIDMTDGKLKAALQPRKVPMKLHIALFLMLLGTVNIAVSGEEEYDLLAFSACTYYRVAVGVGIPDAVDLKPYTPLQQQYVDMINKLRGDKDETWLPWAFSRDGHGKTRGYTSLCKESFDPTGSRYASLECVGAPDNPLGDLSCKFDAKIWGPAWNQNAVCSSKANPHDVIRLYWVDTSEYEMGGSPKINKTFGRDKLRMMTKCHRERQ
jgi:hypothetical protein